MSCSRLAVLAAALVSVLAWASSAHAGDPRPAPPLAAGELRDALAHLQVTAGVLYVGAHPDDDNTTLLAALARGRGLRTAYLSLTRGDGGQNILGSETGDALGVLRTQELLASRRVDGAGQFFSRALDYGFSKSPDEALAWWEHDRALADVVWAIRSFRPDVIVTRFGTDGSGGHGHHTASAILAGEAFRAAADPARFPEQLARVRPWQATRLVWNNWAPKAEDRAAGRVAGFDAGGYDVALGASFGEIGGRARSLNRSQGAGTRERRGPVNEWFQHVDGKPATHDLMDDVATDWSRVGGAAGVAAALHEAERAFDPERPWTSLPALARAHAQLAALPREPIVADRLALLEDVMRSCAGLWLEALADAPIANPGDSVRVTLTLLARTGAPVELRALALPFGAHAYFARSAANAATGSAAFSAPAPLVADSTAPAEHATHALAGNEPLAALATLVLPADLAPTQPYWLEQPRRRGSYELAADADPCAPESAPGAVVRVTLAIANEPVTFDVPVAWRWTDRVVGDRWRALEVLPPASCRFEQSAYLFADGRPHEVRVAVQSTRAALAAHVRLRLPALWHAEPATASLALAAGAESVVAFTVTPGAGAAAETLAAEVEVAGRSWAQSVVHVDYPHVPVQVLLAPCVAHAVHAPLAVRAGAIGYLMGTGDRVPEALQQMGFTVTLLSDADIESGDLSRFACIVSGVRAYNTRPRLRVLQPRLLEWVARGGRLVLQYSTDEDALVDRLGPWPLRIARDRVADEDAPVRFLLPDHALLHTPNAITSADFTGWVQERGLQFAHPFDPRYAAVLSMNDAGEPARDGSLLFAQWGKGTFVYTGLAFFRQLPAGVPGAWRLFANLVSAPR